jgi:hypothetical protein
MEGAFPSPRFGWLRRKLSPGQRRYPSDLDRAVINSWGFQLSWFGAPSRPHFRAVAIPIWFAMLMVSIVPGLWGRRLLNRRRARIWSEGGRCSQCGYDLRASGELCPECGASVSKSAK